MENNKTLFGKWMNKPGMAVLVGLVIGSILVFPDLRSKLIAYLPYLVFLLCPLMHLFMHKHHGNGKPHNNAMEINSTSEKAIESEVSHDR